MPDALRDFRQAACSVLRDSPDPLGLDAVAAYFRLLYFSKGIEALDGTEVGGRTGILPAIAGGQRVSASRSGQLPTRSA